MDRNSFFESYIFLIQKCHLGELAKKPKLKDKTTLHFYVNMLK